MRRMQRIDGHTRVLGLIGNPVVHTLSPVIHNTLSEILGLNRVYVPFQVVENDVQQAVTGAFKLNVLGLNVTVPHKNAVMKAVVDIDPVASGIGAVNTLVREADGYKGYNTDMPGLLRAIQSEGITLKNQTVVILGAGGASKAVAYMCMQEQAKRVYMLNRTVEKAEEICCSMNQLFGKQCMFAASIEEWSTLPKEEWIVFQCTSLGLSPHTDQVVIEEPEFYQQVKIGVDLIYNPAETRFMKLVKAAGGTAVNGLKMLLYQGIIAYELWNDIQVTDEQAELVYNRLYEAIHPLGDNLVLIGFMGSGKSTIGHQIEEKFGYAYLDTDDYIEKREGCSISEIFATKGEDYFRKLETQVLQELIDSTHHTVIATGGGMPLRSENARLLRELGSVIYLEVSEEEVWNRLRNNHDRPLLECGNPQEKIHRMMEQRHPLYQKAAHFMESVNGWKPDEIAARIMQTIENKKNKGL